MICRFQIRSDMPNQGNVMFEKLSIPVIGRIHHPNQGGYNCTQVMYSDVLSTSFEGIEGMVEGFARKVRCLLTSAQPVVGHLLHFIRSAVDAIVCTSLLDAR